MHSPVNRSVFVSVVTAIMLCGLCCNVSAKSSPSLMLEQPPHYGVYFTRQEPAFYTGFAPRCQDPKRIHLHVGRGNQLRVTLVLSREALRNYAGDLLFRYEVYRDLLKGKKLVLTQNNFFEEFETTVHKMEIDRLVSEEKKLSEDEIIARNLELLETLNPGRVFRIHIPVNTLIDNWMDKLTIEDSKTIKTERLLELINLMLPTRLFLAEIKQPEIGMLKRLIATAVSIKGQSSHENRDTLEEPYLALLSKITNHMYPRKKDSLVFTEFTAIYPIGTLNDFTLYQGRKIPLYPAPGRRALTTHQRSKTVDHVPIINIYSYFPWIPYMHVGTKLHNSFHTLWWKMPTSAAFLPENWKQVAENSRNGKPQPYLWLLSRGPMSHGCTHVNAGHISELRQMLPSDTESLYQIDNFRNKSYLYDVFDINGDMVPEVMGVRYFIAFDLKDKKPRQLRVRNERKAYYEWLYGKELQYRANGTAFFSDVRDARFQGRRALDGRTYKNIDLYEAAYEPERVQFFKMVDIPFVQRLRKTAVTFPDGFQPDLD